MRRATCCEEFHYGKYLFSNPVVKTSVIRSTRIHVRFRLLVLSSFRQRFGNLQPPKPTNPSRKDQRLTITTTCARNPSAMPSLTDLPPEILHKIAWNLSSRYSRDVDDCFPSSFGFTQQPYSLIALSHLSRASKYLSDIAQPKLFYSTFDSEKNWVSLIKTLYSRQDLAAAVIELQVGADGDASAFELLDGRYEFSPDNKPDASPEDILMLDKLLCEHFPPGTQQQPHSVDEDGTGDEEVRINACAALAIALVPNIKRLFVEAGYWALPIYKPDSLRCLTELNIVHADTELGFDLQTYRGLLQAAPALQILGCYMVTEISNLAPLSTLHTLHIRNSSLTKESFQHVAATFPHLENFSYSSGGALISDEPEATPGDMLAALRKLSNTIKHLSVDIEGACYMVDLEPQDYVRDLTGMRVLQTLTISGQAIIETHEDTDGNILMDLLPPSICSFTLISPERNMARDINRLAESAAERFPDLKNVTFYHLSNQPWPVDEIPFTTRGIGCSNTGPIFSSASVP